MIPRNTTIPTSKTETFTTAADGQTSVEVHVLQGERPMAAENKSLGRFILDGILPAPRGVPQVEVTFDIDANGILNVSAKDKATGKEQKIVIQSSSGLSDAEIQKMVKDAEEHADDDRRRREEIELRNHADSAHYQAEKMLREQGDKMPEQTAHAARREVLGGQAGARRQRRRRHADFARGAAAGDDGRWLRLPTAARAARSLARRQAAPLPRAAPAPPRARSRASIARFNPIQLDPPLA